MSGEDVKAVSATGRYTITSKETKVQNNDCSKTKQTIEIVKYYAKDGKQIKAGYYAAAEANDLAHNADYSKYYDTRVITKDGKYYLEVEVKKSQKVAILAQDFMGEVDNGVLKSTNPSYFKNYNAGTTPDGKPLSDSNKRMEPGEKLLIPAENLKMEPSPIGMFMRWSFNHAEIQHVK